MIEVQVEGVGVLEFPDGTDKNVIRQTVQNVVTKGQKTTPIPAPTLSNQFPSGEATLIGAGRMLDKIAQGDKQLGLNAVVAGKEALGLNSRPQLDALAKQAEVEQGNDVAYGQLRKQFPFATAAGENLPLAAAPIGQATTLARIGVPAAISALAGAAKYGSPEERALGAAEGGISGAVGGVVGEAARRFINPVQAMPSAAQAAAKAAADKIGAPLLPSQIAGSPSLARLEDTLGRYPGSSGVIGDFVERQNAAVRNRLQAGVGSEGLDAAALGARKADMGQQYSDLRGQISGMPALSNVFDAIDKSTTMLTQGSTKGKEGALGMLAELKDKLYNTKQLTPQEYQGWVTDLAAAARETNNQTIKAALKAVGREMDATARGPLAKEWGQLDAQYANLKTLMKPGITNEVTGDVNLGRYANAYERQGGEAVKTGKASGPMQDVYEYARSVPQLRAGSPTAERQASVMLSPLRFGAAKLLTSNAMRDYLARGLLASPEASHVAGLLAQSGALPLASGTIDLGLLGLLSQ